MSSVKSQIYCAFVIIAFAFTGCSNGKTNDALETYKSWAGNNPPPDLKLINGQYWQSSHWTKEYIMYLEFRPTTKWWEEFLKQNELPEDTGNWMMPGDAPSWFSPSLNAVRFGGGNKFDQGSRYFRDSITGICYIYEIQL